MEYSFQGGRLVASFRGADYTKAWGLKPPARQEAPSCKGSGSAYVETTAPSVFLDSEVTAVFQDAARNLGVKRAVELRWFLPAASAGGFRLLNVPTFDGAPRLKGFVDCATPTVVWLARDIGTDDLLWWVLFHETAHVKQHINGECGSLADQVLEAKANEFADRYVPGYRRRVA